MRFEEFHPRMEAMMRDIAWEYGAKGRRYGADHEDFRQEFAAWLITHGRNVGQRMESNPDDAMDYVGKSLRNRGKDHLKTLRAQTGRAAEDAYLYTRAEVKALLPTMFEPHRWYESARADQAIPEADWVASLTDVMRAYDQLAVDDRDLLAMFHREGWTNKMMAQAADVSEALMSYRHNRALLRLLKNLGASETHDSWKGRRAVSNATARAYQAHIYDDGAQS